VRAAPHTGARRPGNTSPRGDPALRGLPCSRSTFAGVLALVAILTATSRATPSAGDAPSADTKSVAGSADSPRVQRDSNRQGQLNDCPRALRSPRFKHLDDLEIHTMTDHSQAGAPYARPPESPPPSAPAPCPGAPELDAETNPEAQAEPRRPPTPCPYPREDGRR
jgi:hypothetical protein